MNIKESEFCCKRKNLNIRGREFRLDDNTNRKLKAVIISHGFGGRGENLDEYCRAFASWGYAAYRFDFCGGNNFNVSDGETINMSIYTECKDLSSVMDYVKSLPYIEKTQIILAGTSQGGFVSAITAAQRAEEVEKLILISPALCIPDHARAGKLGGALYDPNDVPDIIDCGKMLLGRKFHDEVVNMNPFKEISKYGGPVLILHGTDDKTVDYHYAVRAQKAYGIESCCLHLIKEAGHSFNDKQKKSVISSIHLFLKKHKEILTINVRITGREVLKEGYERQTASLFTGYCDNEYYKGNIIPGAADVQDFLGDKRIRVCADYTLNGVDLSGQSCYIHIINTDVNGEWKPKIETDSKSLDFLNNADLTAVLENCTEGLTVKIFSDVTVAS